ncbi:hypothetical protein Tco_0364255 [Tanacetum coccineum]
MRLPSPKTLEESIFIKDPRTFKSCDLCAKIQACVDIVWKLLVHQGVTFTLKLVKGEEVLKIETTVIAKGVTITKFSGKFPEYKPTKEEEEISKLKAICDNVIYDISKNDSDLESMARSGPWDSEMEDTRGSGIRINA